MADLERLKQLINLVSRSSPEQRALYWSGEVNALLSQDRHVSHSLGGTAPIGILNNDATQTANQVNLLHQQFTGLPQIAAIQSPKAAIYQLRELEEQDPNLLLIIDANRVTPEAIGRLLNEALITRGNTKVISLSSPSSSPTMTNTLASFQTAYPYRLQTLLDHEVEYKLQAAILNSTGKQAPV